MPWTDQSASVAGPLYQQVRERLRQSITRGEYRPGDRLPSEPELITRFAVSRITVRQALADLEAEGYVVRRHGKGTYVTTPPIPHDLLRLTDFVEDMAQAGLAPSSRVLAYERLTAPAAVAAALALGEAAPVTRIDRLRLADGQPIALDVTWLPDAYATLLTRGDLERETILQLLETRFAIVIERGMLTLSAVNATAEQAEALEVAPGAALLTSDRLALLGGGEPLYWQRRWYRPDRARYQIQAQRAPKLAATGQRIEMAGPVFAPRPQSTSS